MQLYNQQVCFLCVESKTDKEQNTDLKMNKFGFRHIHLNNYKKTGNTL